MGDLYKQLEQLKLRNKQLRLDNKRIIQGISEKEHKL